MEKIQNIKNIIENKIKLDLKELLKGLTNVSWIWETTTEEDIHSISERLKEIKKNICNIFTVEDIWACNEKYN